MRRIVISSSIVVLILIAVTAIYLRTEREKSFDRRFQKAEEQVRALAEDIDAQVQAKSGTTEGNE